MLPARSANLNNVARDSVAEDRRTAAGYIKTATESRTTLSLECPYLQGLSSLNHAQLPRSGRGRAHHAAARSCRLDTQPPGAGPGRVVPDGRGVPLPAGGRPAVRALLRAAAVVVAV